MKTVRLLAVAIAAAAVLSTTACTIDPTFGAGSSGGSGSSNNSGGSGGGSGGSSGGSGGSGGDALPDPSELEEAIEDAFDTGEQSSGDSAQEQADPKIDACMLLTDDEITEITGPHSGGKRSVAVGDPEPDGSWCSYENPETYHSVTIRISDDDTAPGGRLPEISDYGTTEPGPDGIRLASGGIAEFALGNRLCDVQVVTDPTDDSGDHQVAIMFIGLIRDRA